MDMNQLEKAIAARASKNGLAPAAPVSKTKAAVVTNADPKSRSAAKSAAAAAIAAKLGGGMPRGPPPPGASAPSVPRPAPGASAASTQSLSPGDEAIAGQYRKMVKMGLPAGAVRQKMAAGGVPGHIVESVMAGGGPSAGGSAPARGAAPAPPPRPAAGGGKVSSLTPKEEKFAAQYRKMVKLGLPPGAVRHKMAADGISVKIQDSVIAGEISAAEAGSASAAPAAAAPRSNTAAAASKVSSLSPREEATATQYRKLVKMGLPQGAVRHKMNADGVSGKIQDSVIAGEVPKSQGGGEADAAAPASRPPPNPALSGIAVADTNRDSSAGELKTAPPMPSAPSPPRPAPDDPQEEIIDPQEQIIAAAVAAAAVAVARPPAPPPVRATVPKKKEAPPPEFAATAAALTATRQARDTGVEEKKNEMVGEEGTEAVGPPQQESEGSKRRKRTRKRKNPKPEIDPEDAADHHCNCIVM